MPHWGSSSLCGKVSTGKNYSITTSFLFVSVYSYISTLSKSYGILGFSTNLQTCPPTFFTSFDFRSCTFKICSFVFAFNLNTPFLCPLWIFVSFFKHCPNYFREGVRGVCHRSWTVFLLLPFVSGILHSFFLSFFWKAKLSLSHLVLFVREAVLWKYN